MLNKLTIRDCRLKAKSKRGKLIDKIYFNSVFKMEWECELKHRWKTSGHNVVRGGTWCPFCAGRAKRDIYYCQSIAMERGGKCLSTEYTNTLTRMCWECSSGHTWDTTLSSIQRGSWCPECPSYRSERICRTYFETILGESFPKSKPDWLKTKMGRMELDGYCEKLKIAFEHQGEQHYRLCPIFSKSQKDFEDLVKRDNLKRNLCKKNNVLLIEIPALNIYTRIEDLEDLIFKKLKMGGIIPNIKRPICIDWNKTYISSDISDFQNLKDFAILKGGKLLSTVYNGIKFKYKWECAEGHIWMALGSSVAKRKPGTWCKICSGKAKKDISYLQEKAKNIGIFLISKRYGGMDKKYVWKCKEGHTWRASASKIINCGQRCPDCSIGRRKEVICLQTGGCL